MDCYACSNEASRQCRRCSRLYCEVHGGDLCAECLSPTSALPSFNLYRGSLLALLVGTAVAVWLLVQPPGPGGSGEEITIIAVTPTIPVTEVLSTDTTPSLTPGTATPPDEATPEPATSTPGTPEPSSYTVEGGDTLIDIARRFAPPGVDAFDYADDIANVNDFDVDAPITPGQELILP